MFSRNSSSIVELSPEWPFGRHALKLSVIVAMIVLSHSAGYAQNARPVARPLDQIDRRIEERRQQEQQQVPTPGSVAPTFAKPGSSAIFQIRQISTEGRHAI